MGGRTWGQLRAPGGAPGLRPECLERPHPLCQVSGTPACPSGNGVLRHCFPPPLMHAPHLPDNLPPGQATLAKNSPGARPLPAAPALGNELSGRKNQHSPGPKIDGHPDSEVWGLSVEGPGGGIPGPALPLTHSTRSVLTQALTATVGGVFELHNSSFDIPLTGYKHLPLGEGAGSPQPHLPLGILPASI